MKVAIAGASGFIGRSLIENIKDLHHLIGLSRSSQNPNEVEWRTCDLFSMLDAEKGLEGADVAIYLVHSMRPSANLTQGSFADFDLIAADNFLRAAQKKNVKQVIFLGGLHPEKEASPHLRSRKEVEDLFIHSSVPATILRAAIILGAEGSSFHIMTRLVDRLPVMVAPAWTRTFSQPVALQDVIESLKYCIGNAKTYNKIYDVAGPDIVSYQNMMMTIAELKGLKRHIIPVPLITPQLSTLWVCMITQAPKALVKPLIAGLRTSLTADPAKMLTLPNYSFLSLREALKKALSSYQPQKKPLAFQSPSGNYVVRSVQRLYLPRGMNAEVAAKEYMHFLPHLGPPMIRVEVQGHWIYFCIRFIHLRLLVLEYSPERSTSDRQLFYVRGGLLARKTVRGRLEFREVLSHKALIAAIHDFEPRLPWFIYRWTQALAHVWTMRMFSRSLKRHDSQLKEARYPSP